MIEKVKAAYAAVSAWIEPALAWIDGNPRKAWAAGFAFGFAVKWVF